MEPDLNLLEYLTGKGARYIEEAVQGTGYLPRTVVGVATNLLDMDGDVELLTAKQKVTYEKFLVPLLFDVPCQGIAGPQSCRGDGRIETEALIACYNSGDFHCRACRAALAEQNG
jgi:hypothetical protein